MKTYLILLLAVLFYAPIAFSQNSAKELIDQGYASYEDGNYEMAISYFDKAEKLDNKNPELYYLRGVCKSMSDNNDDAITDFDRAIKLNPNYAEAYFERGYSYFILNDANKSIESYSEAIRIDPNYGEAYQNRGAVKCMNEDEEGARKDWEKAKELGVMVPEMGC